MENLIRNPRKRIFQILAVAKKGDIVSKVFDIFILGLIFLNVVAVIIETIPVLRNNYKYYFWIFEVFSIVIFSIEYLLRVWTAVENKAYSKPLTGRIKYIFTPMAICDFFAIFPFFLTFTKIDFRFLRILRLFRVFRVFKIGRYYSSLEMIKNVFKSRKEELILSTFIMLTLLVLSSSIMYEVENAVQPEKFSSIPATMWWAVATLTTVGYGDIYPITVFGKLIASIIAILGVAMFAMPAGIIASGFIEEIQKKKNRDKKAKCPNCGFEH